MERDRRNPTGTGASYIRVSKDEQDTDRQRAAVSGWLKNRELSVRHAIEDKGSRDKSEERAGFQTLLDYVEKSHVQWVVIPNLDRLGVKDSIEFNYIVYRLRVRGCELWSVADNDCISDSDFSTVIKNTVGGMTSQKEQEEKGWKSITTKVRDAKAGKWVGGFVPYGLDVICVRGEATVWRMIIEGKDRRLVIDAAGHETRYDGKDVVPSHTRNVETLWLTPSVREERITTVNEIFTWFDREAISTGRIADRLNARGEPTTVGKPWYAMLIEGILANPVYVGRPSYNKRAHGRFWEFKDGEFSKAPRKNNYYQISGRNRDKSEWVTPEKPVFDPIVPPDVFARVQEKLDARQAKPRAPKADTLWLAGLVYCGKCGKKMSGATYKSEKGDWRSFLCVDAVRYGVGNTPCGCLSHRVRHVVIEEYVAKWISENHRDLEGLINPDNGAKPLPRGGRGFRLLPPGSAVAKQPPAPLLAEVKHLNAVADSLVDRITAHICQALGDGTHAMTLAKGDVVVTIQGDRLVLKSNNHPFSYASMDEMAKMDDITVFDIYEAIRSAHREDIQRQLDETTAELNDLVEGFKGLTSPRAKDLANARMKAVEDRITELEGLLDPLGDVSQIRASWWNEVQDLTDRIGHAMRALKDGENRRKADAVRQVIGKITCNFDYKQHGRQTRSVLASVEIEPVRSVSNSISPGPG